MANHNILITNPKGERRHQFLENVSRDDCVEWLDEYGPAPIGWFYQIVNLNKKVRKRPEYVRILGFKDTSNGSYELVDERKAGVKLNNGQWYSVKKAKRDARTQGATWFTREKVWKEEQAT